MSATPSTDCETFAERFFEWAEETLPLDERAVIDQHLAQCEACDVYAHQIEDAVCEEIQRHVNAYLDRELEPAELERVEFHLGLCGRCADRFRFEGNVLHYVRHHTRAAALPEGEVERVLARFRARLEGVERP